MKEPKVSVIMPVYNAEVYLQQTIDSILSQTFTDFEFLIVDDGSFDRSLEILNSYTDKRIKVFKNDKNIGYVRSLNKLIELSKGEYIARQDNDDIALPKRIESQVQFLNENQDIGICGTNALIFGNKKKMTLVPTRDNEIRAYMLISSPLLHPTVMFRKSIFTELKIDKYDESLCPAEDYAMWFEISKKTKLANLPEPLLKYRLHANNTSQHKKKEQIEKANIIRKNIFKFTLAIEISDEEASLLNLISSPELINADNLISLEQLLKKIIRKNDEIGYYEKTVLQNLFFYFWTKVCFKAQKINRIKIIRLYFMSSLYNNRNLRNIISSRSVKKFIFDQKN